MTSGFTELFGYAASVFVAISLLMSSFLMLRVLNLIGAIAFVVYGLLLGSVPIILTNGFITLIDIWYLVRMLRPDLNGVRYGVIAGDKRHLIDDFVSENLEDIIRFFPSFRTQQLDDVFLGDGTAFVATRNLKVIGFALTEPIPNPEATSNPELRELYATIVRDLFPEKSLLITVDYIKKKYRGLGLFRRLYSEVEWHFQGTIEYFLASLPNTARVHRRFLERTGYEMIRSVETRVLLAKDLRAES